MLKWLFRRGAANDPYHEMMVHRFRADRAALDFLEPHAVNATITPEMVARAADAINRTPTELVSMIPDRRREDRYVAARAGLRTTGLDRTGDYDDGTPYGEAHLERDE